MSRYKGWKLGLEFNCIITGDQKWVYRHPDYKTCIGHYGRSYWWYRDTPGGQRSRVMHDRLRDAIAAVHEHEKGDTE
jgi:hypothetical protein